MTDCLDSSIYNGSLSAALLSFHRHDSIDVRALKVIQLEPSNISHVAAFIRECFEGLGRLEAEALFVVDRIPDYP